MASTFFYLNCDQDGRVTVEITGQGDEVIFHGYDPDAETELAAQELGFTTSLCWFFWIAAQAVDDAGLRFDPRSALAFLSAVSPDPHLPDPPALSECLVTAAEKGQAALVVALLETGADVHENHDQALRWASKEGHGDVVAILLDAGADVNADMDSALRWAVAHSQTDVLPILLDAGANMDVIDDDLLRLAGEYGRTQVLLTLEAWIAEHG